MSPPSARDARAVRTGVRRRSVRPTSPLVIVAVIALTGLTAAFMQMVIVPIQSQLPELLDAPRTETAWVITITLLTGAVATPITGRLGDMVGKRRISLVLLGLITLGSVIAAVAPDIIGVIIGRGLQGVGIGVIPLGISIMRDTLPERRLYGGVAVMSATLGAGGAIGLPLGAVVSDLTDWRVIFWIAAGLAALCVVLTLVYVPVSALRTPGRFDWVGAIGLTAGLVGILLALSRGAEWGWTAPLTLGLGLGGLAILVLWGWYELRAGNPLVDLRVAGRAPVLLTNASSLLIAFALFVFNVGFPQYLELAPHTGGRMGLTLTETGLVLLPSGIMMLIMSPISGRLSRSVGPKSMLIVGAGIVAASFASCLLEPTALWQALGVSVLFGAGHGIAFAAIPMLIMRAVPITETAAANGLNALMRSIGPTASAALVGAILAALTTSYGSVVVPTQDAFRLAFWIGLAAAALGALVAVPIPRHTPRLAQVHPALPDGR